MTPGPNLKFGMLMLVAVFAVSAVGLYGAARLIDDPPVSAEEVVESEGEGVPGGPIRLVAKDLKFDKRTVTASAGANVTVTLDNQDPGVLHNVSFYTNNRATQSIFVGRSFPGPAAVDEQFAAPPGGNYYFRCDVHPDTMSGTFTVR